MEPVDVCAEFVKLFGEDAPAIPRNAADVEAMSDFLISDFEMILAFAIVIGVNYLYGYSFKRLTRYANRKLKRNIEWEDNAMG